MGVYRLLLLSVALFDGGTLLCGKALVDGAKKALAVEQETCRAGVAKYGESVNRGCESRERAERGCYGVRLEAAETEMGSGANEISPAARLAWVCIFELI